MGAFLVCLGQTADFCIAHEQCFFTVPHRDHALGRDASVLQVVHTSLGSVLAQLLVGRSPTTAVRVSFQLNDQIFIALQQIHEVVQRIRRVHRSVHQQVRTAQGVQDRGHVVLFVQDDFLQKVFPRQGGRLRQPFGGEQVTCPDVALHRHVDVECHALSDLAIAQRELAFGVGGVRIGRPILPFEGDGRTRKRHPGVVIVNEGLVAELQRRQAEGVQIVLAFATHTVGGEHALVRICLERNGEIVARGVQWERQHLGLGKRQLALTHFSLPQVQGPQTVSAVGRPVEIAVVTERREHLVACGVDGRTEVLGNGACKGTLLRLDVPQVLAAESAWEVRRENEELVVWRQCRVPHLRAVVFIPVHQAKGHRGAEAVALLLREVDVARQVGPVHLHAAGEEQRFPFAVEAGASFIVLGAHGVAQGLRLAPAPFLVLFASEQIHEGLACDGILVRAG